MKKLLAIFLIITGCNTPKQTETWQTWHIKKPETEQEWKALKRTDSLMNSILHIDSTTYDWDKKVATDWKKGEPMTYKFN